MIGIKDDEGRNILKGMKNRNRSSICLHSIRDEKSSSLNITLLVDSLFDERREITVMPFKVMG
jgi:hypothetical protein